MSTYLIGDVHGCYDELIALLAQVEFDPSTDTLWLTGDLVARGPGSLEVLRYVKSLGDSVRLVLGNHDLHLLAVFAGISRNKPKDRLKPLLEAPDADELLNWLRRQPLLIEAYRLLHPRRQAWALRDYKDYIYHGPNFYLPHKLERAVTTFHDISIFTCPEYHPKDRVRYMEKSLHESLDSAKLISRLLLSSAWLSS